MPHLFSLVNEVYSEKQRRWACAQMGDNFEGKRSLTKSQAKEMCTSKIQEQEEIDNAELEEIKQVISNLVNKFIESGVASELKPASDIEKDNIDIEDVKKSLFNSIMSHVGEVINNIVKEEEVNETAAMASGAISGHMGNKFYEEK